MIYSIIRRKQKLVSPSKDISSIPPHASFLQFKDSQRRSRNLTSFHGLYSPVLTLSPGVRGARQPKKTCCYLLYLRREKKNVRLGIRGIKTPKGNKLIFKIYLF